MRNLPLLAAAFARSNMGQPRATKEELKFLDGCGLDTCVETLCAEFMENDDHYDMFIEEARSWKTTLGKMTVDEMRGTWPEMIERMDGLL